MRHQVHATPGPGDRVLVLLLHGRGESASDWTRVHADLDLLAASRVVPPLVLVAPDGPWSDGGHYWRDSAFTGQPPGHPVATELVEDLLPEVEERHDAGGSRERRIVVGYSMGGAGAVELLISRPETFGGAVAVSPASYDPLPPAGSSTRRYGAFGRGPVRFDDDVYHDASYRALLARVDPDLPLRLALATGDEEWRHPDEADRHHDLDHATAALHAMAADTPGVTTTLSRRHGGHDWSVWRPAVVDGLAWVCQARVDRAEAPA